MNNPHASPLTPNVLHFTSPVTRLLPLGILLLAFFLRLYRLADKNVWWDEGWSIWLSKQDFAAIALRTAADEHPPLHYWMLKVWTVILGSNAYAGRYLSVAFGLLTIALIYRIGKKTGGCWVGILAAFILAISRFHIWWSQDIKNYTLSIFFAFSAVWFMLALADGKPQSNRSCRYAIGYSLTAILAMFTHYLAALVLLALNVYALMVIASHASRQDRWLVTGRWLTANALAAALFSPWLYLYLQNAQSWVAQPTFNFGLFLELVATVLPLGVTTDIDYYFWVTATFTALASVAVVWGLWSAIAQQSRVNNRPLLFTARWSLFAWIVLLPPFLIYLLSLTPAAIFAPKIQARYLVILAPAYAMLLAFGVTLISRRSRYFALFALLFLIASSGFVLRDYYAERRLTDDYATLANTINAFARQGDLVLLDTDQEWPTFLYYLRAPLDWLGIPNGAPMNDSNADSLIKRALNRTSAVWLVTIPDALATDPQKMVEARLARTLTKRLDQTYGDKRVRLFASDERDLVQVPAANLQIQHPMPFIPFGIASDPNGHQAQLIGYDLPIREARRGDVFYVTTYWHAAATHGELQLSDSSNHTANSAPFDLATGKDVRVVTALNVPPSATGEYIINVHLTAQTIALARIRVEPSASIAPTGKISHSTDYRLGTFIRLLGYDLPQTRVRAGEQLPITIYWRAEAAVNNNYVAFVHLLGNEFNAAQGNFLWGQVDRIPTLPMTAWQIYQAIADPYRVPIAVNAPAGKYKVEVGLYDPATGVRLKMGDGSDSIILAEIDIAAR